MNETRLARIRAVILEELSTVVAREVKDPRVPLVTFTQVELTPDASQATVYVSILGSLGGPGLVSESAAEGAPVGEVDEAAEARVREATHQMKQCLVGLNSAAGYLRRHLAKVLNIRHVPNLTFKEDRGLANASRVHELLKKISSG